MTLKLLLLPILVLISCNFNNAADYIKEKPEYLQTCERKMPKYAECLTQAFDILLTKWNQGVPGVDDNFSMDPIFIKTYEIADNAKDAPLSVQMINVTYTGLAKTNLKSVNFTEKNFNFQLNYQTPLTRFAGQYSAMGKISLLPINSNGSMVLDIKNTDFTVSLKTKLKQRDDMKFFDLKALKFQIKHIENVDLRLENLFTNKELTENLNVVFNDNWREFFSTFQPTIERSLSEIFSRYFQHIFNSVPAKFFIADVESIE